MSMNDFDAKKMVERLEDGRVRITTGPASAAPLTHAQAVALYNELGKALVDDGATLVPAGIMKHIDATFVGIRDLTGMYENELPLEAVKRMIAGLRAENGDIELLARTVNAMASMIYRDITEGRYCTTSRPNMTSIQMFTALALGMDRGLVEMREVAASFRTLVEELDPEAGRRDAFIFAGEGMTVPCKTHSERAELLAILKGSRPEDEEGPPPPGKGVGSA